MSLPHYLLRLTHTLQTVANDRKGKKRPNTTHDELFYMRATYAVEPFFFFSRSASFYAPVRYV
jgi:hypothetical protein